MKTLLFRTFTLSIAFSIGLLSFGQTDLDAGDIAIIGFNFDDPDSISFVLLTDIEAGTEIKFTDNGWTAGNTFRTGEGIDVWTAATSYKAGKVLDLPISNMTLSASGDQVLAYQGDDSSPSFIFAINNEGSAVWQADATNTNESAIPSGLSNGTNALALNEIDNSVYTELITDGTKTEILTAVCNSANWSGSNTDRNIFSFSDFIVTPSINLLSPTGGEKFYGNDSPIIQWKSASVKTVNIKVYNPYEAIWEEVISDTPSDGSEAVLIPSDIISGDLYRLAVIDSADPAIADTSEVFTIVATPSINEIQSNNTLGASNYELRVIRTTGTVSYINGTDYYIMDGTGMWNGILVSDPVNAGSLNIGDNITIEATIEEYNEITRLTGVVSVVVNSSGNLVETTIISANQMDESYESVLLQIVKAKVTNEDIGNGEFEINDGAATLIIDDLYYAHSAVLNEKITLTAMGYFSNGAYKIVPKSASDIVSANDSITSSEYFINYEEDTISAFPYSTSLATFKSNISVFDSATFNVFDENGTSIATDLDSTKLLIVTAADNITKTTYAISPNAALTDVNVSSPEYTVNNLSETIIDIPLGTILSTFKSNIVPPEYGSFEVYLADGITVASDLQTGYILKSLAEDNVSGKSYTITINTIPLDTDSYVQAPVTQVPSATITIVDGDEGAEAFPVFAFDIFDAGSGDGEPTELNEIVLYYGSNNTIDFIMDIDSGFFEVDGAPVDLAGEPVFGTDSIYFPIGLDEIIIADGGSKTVTLKLVLNENAAEGNVIQFMVDADQHGFGSHASGSDFATVFSSDIEGNNITIDAVATELQFSQQPGNVNVGDTIKPEVIVVAVDANGNTDSDYNSNVVLTAAGATLKHAEYTKSTVGGIVSFDTLVFTTAGTGVTLLAASSGLISATSSEFSVIALSSNANLTSISVDGTPISEFTASNINYTIELAKGTTEVPDVTYTVEDSEANAVLTEATSLPGTTTIQVTAEDGTIKTYSVSFTLALSQNADLSSISVNGVAIEEFSSIQLNYSVELPVGTTEVPEVNYELADTDASASVTDASSIPGTTTILVTAENGATKTYSVVFEYATSSVEITLNNIHFYPSPVKTMLNIENLENVDKLQVVDITGKLVYSKVLYKETAISIDANAWNEGLYILVAVSGDKVSSKRFIKE